MKKNVFRRGFAFFLALALLAGYIPAISVSAEDAQGLITTVADPQTLTRPEEVYGTNTQNAGKVTVGKSVTDVDTLTDMTMTLDGKDVTALDADNFLVTITQTAQVMGLASESAVPLDVVFVLDASSSMSNDDRSTEMVNAANTAISSLLAANPNNRVGVVAYSGSNNTHNDAVTVLTPLDTYTGTAATNHLRWVTSSGSTSGGNRIYIQGRANSGAVAGRRHAQSTGTNLQAGIVAGAKLLLNNTSTTVEIDGTTVTRMPFLVVLTDGAPSCQSTSQNWWDPDTTTQTGAWLSDSVGAGFTAAVTAAYYKSAITEHYYGASASNSNYCNIYTIGVSVSNGDLAQMALNPLENFVSSNTSSEYDDFVDFWSDFTADPARNFTIEVNGNGSYTFVAGSAFEAARDRVMGKNSSGVTMYTGGLAYNDDYFDAANSSEIAAAFDELVSTIQKKAASVPTKVTEAGADFSGYVNFYDPIGEYMEVKEMKGIIANGNFYRGTTFTDLLTNPGKNPEFDATFKRVLTERMRLSESNIDVDSFITYASNNNDGTNSLCWWGKEHDVGEEDIAMQVLGNAKTDSISYIETSKATADAIPDGATHVCRSYFFYGTAGGTVQNPNHEYLYFVVRVQRSLTAPYQQTVVISAPASLLSMDKVSITEDTSLPLTDPNRFTAEVEDNAPARVVYEVGLRSDITPQNVGEIVAAAYKEEETVGTGSVNYDATTGTYNFFTNDWNRGAEAGSHQRAMAKATFDAAADNSFYAYQEDTILLTKVGDSYEPYEGSEPVANQEFYYARTYYSWKEGTADANGVYPANQETAYIKVTVPSGVSAHEHIAQNSAGQWYIKKGTYTSSTVVAGDDTGKTSNTTGTAANVKYVRNTTNMANSHYTVMLGNNGMLTLEADTTKTVTGTRPTDTTIVLQDGSTVMVGDELTYTIKVVNNDDAVATAKVTDSVPAGTEFISADPSVTPDANGGLVWNLTGIAANSVEYVTFKVRVTEEALEEAVVSVDNTAFVELSNGEAYTTNTTKNPPFGKTVSDPDGAALPADGVQVGQELIYRIRFANDTDEVQDITITDIIPAGTHYVENTASHNGKLSEDGKSLEWNLTGVQPNTFGVVTFRVIVDASARDVVENDATIKIGPNDPGTKTNPTETKIKTGSLTLSKDVNVISGNPATETFTLLLTEAGGDLSGNYAVSGVSYSEITFVNGQAYMLNADGDPEAKPGLKIKDGESLTIANLPANAEIVVIEAEANTLGFTTTYTGLMEGNEVTIPDGSAAEVTVTNTYAVSSVGYQLRGTKRIDGVLPEDVTFTFVAQACNPDGTLISGGAIATGKATVPAGEKEATIEFSPRTFSTAGTYRYLITETAEGALGMTYDTTQYMLVITVSDKNGDGKLVAEQQLFTLEGGSFTAAQTDLVFTNVYEEPEVKVNLEGTKVLNGRDTAGNEFSFVLKDSTGTVVGYASSGAAKQGQPATFTFSPLTFDKDDVDKSFTYTISEATGSLPGITYSTDEYTVTIDVSKDANNKLVATVNYPASGVNFTNSYETSASVNLQAKKALSGVRTELKDGETYSFEVLQGTTVVATGNNDRQGNVTFSAIGYTLKDMGGLTEKTFEYTIQEIIPDLGKDPYIQYSDAKVKVTVKVTYDAATGALTVGTPVYEGGAVPTFTNVVNNDYVTATPDPLTKETTTSGGVIPADATFSFSVVAMDGNVVGTGNGKANGDITFSTLTFTAPGEYKYFVQESSTGNIGNGIDYSDARYLWTVVVSYDAANSKLVVDSTAYTAYNGTGDENDPASYTTALVAPHFVNTYDAQGMATVHATKSLAGRTLQAGEFDFQLERLDRITHIVNGTNDAAGNISFGNLYYTDADFATGETTATVRYKMTEIVSADNKLTGVTYDSTVYYVKVTLTLDGAEVKTAVTYHSDEACESEPVTPVFKNEYEAQDTNVTIEVSKRLEGRTAKENEFSFELVHLTENGQNVVATASNDASGKVVFNRTYFSETFPGAAGETVEVKYLIREVKGSLGGVTYSSQVFGVKLNLTNDTKLGQLVASAPVYYEGSDFTKVLTGTPVFVNTYVPEGTTVTPVATKKLDGKVMADNDFSFQVKDLSTGDVVSTGLSKADEKVVFTPISYTKAGEYQYEITELVGTLAGVKYDTTKFYMAVKVEDKGDGTLTAEAPAYYSDSNFTTALTEVVFENSYIPSGTTIQLEGTKTMNGRDMADGEFDFLVKEGDTVVTYGTNVAGTDGTAAEIVFGTIAYKTAGVHEYTISEIVPSDAAAKGLKIDTRTFKVTVNVVDAGDGKLVATATYPTPVAFVNSYDAEDAYVVLTAQKHLVNKKLNAGEFVFQLKQGDTVLETVKNNDKGLVSFSSLTFNKEGTYTYTVEEVGVSSDMLIEGGNYKNDSRIYTVVVTVTDDDNGKHHASAKYLLDGEEVQAIEFLNTYTPAAIDVDLNATIGAAKTLNGRDMVAGEFTFQIIDISKNEMSSGSNDASGKITFKPLHFETAGIYNYRIVEVLDNLPASVTGDARQWRLQIHVRYDETTGLLTVDEVNDVHIRDLDNNTAQVEFENNFVPAPITVTIPVTKKLEGRPLQAGDFLFQLKEGSFVRDEVRNGGEGHVNFNLTFDKAGVYNYTIHEVNEGKPGITYSDNVTSVRVTVTANAETGTLVPSVSFTGGEKEFVNSYDPAGCEAVIEIEKMVSVPTGSTFVMRGDEFTFELYKGTELTDANKIASTTNDLDGYASFKLAFTKDPTETDKILVAGEETKLVYTVKEVAGTDKWFKYDETVHTVIVTVKDNYDGSLTASVEYPEDTIGAAVFENQYLLENEQAVVRIDGYKTYTDAQGKDLTVADGQFSFGLYENDKLVGEAVECNEKGQFAFVLTYGLDQIGTYNYTIKEIKGDNPSITYDTKSYDVTVEVKDDHAGNLVAEAKITLKGEQVNNVYFANIYNKPDDLNVTLDIVKKVTNKTQTGITPEGFEIVLNQNGVETTVKTDKNGDASFTLTFTAEDIGKTFQMTVYEKKGNVAGVTYDTTVHTLKIQVTQNSDGKLVSVINDKTSSKATITFTNTYAEPGTPATGDNSMIYPMVGLMVLSAAGCVFLLLMMNKKRYKGKYKN